jgi:hypothetical protein
MHHSDSYPEPSPHAFGKTKESKNKAQSFKTSKETSQREENTKLYKAFYLLGNLC